MGSKKMKALQRHFIEDEPQITKTCGFLDFTEKCDFTDFFNIKFFL
jgi:hypothetical protein